MERSKVLIILLVIVVLAIIAGGIYKSKKHVKEGFLGNLPSMQTKVWRSMGNQKGDLFSIPGQYQSMLSPRMNAGINYGANIRYNAPDYANMAVPCDPLALSDMVSASYMVDNKASGKSQTKEGYCGSGCASVGCKKGGGSPAGTRPSGPIAPTDYAAGNFKEVRDNLYTDNSADDTVSMLPVGDMTMTTALGDVVQPVIYDRFVYANRNNRLRSQGDPIRGDLPIIPCSSDWFRPSVHPQIDLQTGALNVIGGIQNDTSTQLAGLVAAASGGTDPFIGGVNMASQFDTTLGSAFADVSVSSFP